MGGSAVHEAFREPVSFQAAEQPVRRNVGELDEVVADLAERLVAADRRALHDVLSSAMQQLGRALHMDLGGLWQRSEAGSPIEPRHQWLQDPQLAGIATNACPALAAVATEGIASLALWFTRGDYVLHPSVRRVVEGHGVRSGIALPVGAADRGPRAALVFASMTADDAWEQSTITQLRIVAAVIGQALARCNAESGLEKATHVRDSYSGLEERDTSKVRVLETPYLRNRLRVENECLRHEFQERLGESVIVGQSDAVKRVLEQARQVALTDSTVLLLGETGTGKELIATHIHELSARRGRVMVRVNCSAIPSTLIESELFGREKGAFTGALSRQAGRFETAEHSTIFLDEIGDLPAEVQVKLLRVLEERQIERLGSPRSLPIDVRIIAATHRDLEKRIAEDTFREDLFYRLNVFPIRVPALRDRAEDIPLLVWRFVIEFAKSFGKRIESISRENMELLQRYHWPGNIRELRNVVERAMIVATGPRLVIPLPATAPVTSGPVRVRLEDVEREHIRAVLERVRWRIRGLGGAAEQLGLRPTTLETRMAKLGLVRPKSA
jgi:transcriptional regulator with GAF, ATPase, and Fis domain